MDIKWGTAESGRFATNVSIISTKGKSGYNVATAEWVHHVSYSPGIVMVNMHPRDTTATNIIESKEFGVSIAAENQNVVSSIAGGSHGIVVDKIAMLKDMGVEFYNAEKIDAMMVKGAAMNLECHLIKYEELGDHIAFFGEVVGILINESVQPILYHDRKYFKVGENIPRPGPEIIEKIKSLMEKHAKKPVEEDQQD